MSLTRKLVIKILKEEKFKIKINTKLANIDFLDITPSNHLSQTIKNLLSLLNETHSNIHLTTKYFVKVNRLRKVIKEREHF